MFEIFLELYGDSDSLKIASTSDYCNELDFEKLGCYHTGVQQKLLLLYTILWSS